MERSGFLVLHFQNSVAHSNGVWGRNLYPQVAKNGSIENTRKAIDAARMRGYPIIYVNVEYRRDAPELPRYPCGLFKDAKHSPDGQAGSWGTQVIEELAPRHDDIIVVNFNSDGFQGTVLDMILRNMGIRHVFICGQCVEHVVATTMKRAVNMGYQATLLSDCTSGFTDLNYEAMMNILPLYGDLITSDDFVKRRYQAPVGQSSYVA